MQKAIINTPFSVVQWHGKDYPYYDDDSENNTYQVGDEVTVLHEAEPNPMGKLYVVFNPRINNATVVTVSYLDFIDEQRGDYNMRLFIYPFQTTFVGKEITAWAVNCDEPETTGGMTTMEKCPHCGEKHVYKFVDGPFDVAVVEEKSEAEESHHCKCASCRKEFVAKIDMCY